MKIKKLKINNYIGIEELDWDPGMINIIEGPKGTGKTSITEAIETALSNNKRRTEVISHGKDEALLFVETDEGLEVDRRLRTDKSDYLKLNGDMVAKSTESELRKFFRGDIFRPLDFIDLSIDEQTEIILSMIKMDYSNEEINDWFGENVLKDINTSKHLLQILKDIERKYYNERTEINREIRSLESQVKGIESELPPNYDGGKWKNEKVQEYYDKVSKARELNRKIEKAETLKANFEDRISAIEAEGKSKLGEVREKYQQQKEEIKEEINNFEDKISEEKEEIRKADKELDTKLNAVDDWLEKEFAELKKRAADKKESAKEEATAIKGHHTDYIHRCNQKISAKESELNGLDKQKELELKSIDKEVVKEVEAEREKLSEAEELLEEKEKVEVEPLQEEADQVAEMKEYLSEWNRMVQIREGQLAQKKEYSAHLTALIEIARDKPSELIQKHEMPLEGISVDEEGLIRIEKTLLDGLSSGEKLEVAFQIALQRMGMLEIMCLDGFEKLNKSEQEKILKMCRENEIQAFVTITKDTENNERIIRSDSNEEA